MFGILNVNVFLHKLGQSLWGLTLRKIYMHSVMKWRDEHILEKYILYEHCTVRATAMQFTIMGSTNIRRHVQPGQPSIEPGASNLRPGLASSSLHTYVYQYDLLYVYIDSNICIHNQLAPETQPTSTNRQVSATVTEAPWRCSPCWGQCRTTRDG